MVAALLAQEGLTVFCIYLLIFHLFFFKKECSHGHLVALSGTRACSRALEKVRPLPLERQMFLQGAGQLRAEALRARCCQL